MAVKQLELYCHWSHTIGAIQLELYNWSYTAGHPDNLFIPATSSLIVPSVTIKIHEGADGLCGKYIGLAFSYQEINLEAGFV